MLHHLVDHQGDPILDSFHDRTEMKLNRGKIEITLSIQFAIRMNSPRLLLHLIKQGSDLEA
ncbi:hypothetical protein KSS87_012324 [Heliosperma pusillum]|nr:hypothetical protein KSS87_012324 [Heliosperma pusillum]